MIRISFITLVALVCICIAIYALWTIRVSRQKPSDLLTESRKADNSVHRLNDSLKNDPAGTGAFIKRDSFRLPEVELAIRANAISNCIDSIKHDLVLLARQKEGDSFSYQNDERLLRLKTNLADYNSFIQKFYPGKSNITQDDLVNVEDVLNGPAAVPWEIYYFKKSSVLTVITELNFINTQVLKLQRKATN